MPRLINLKALGSTPEAVHDRLSNTSLSKEECTEIIRVPQEFVAPNPHANDKMSKKISNARIDDKRKIRKNFFPYHLIDILSNPLFEDVICWMSDGKSFIIKDSSKFSDIVLSKTFYKNSNIHSFIRKMHRWGFKMVTRGKNKDEYSHPLFLREDPNLCEGMTCKPKRRLSGKLHKREDVISYIDNTVPSSNNIVSSHRQYNRNSKMFELEAGQLPERIYMKNIQQRMLHNGMIKERIMNASYTSDPFSQYNVFHLY